MPKSRKTKIILAVVSVLIVAVFLFLCYLVVAIFLAEKDRQANLDLWESQKQALAEQGAIDSSTVTTEEIEYTEEVDINYDMLAAEDFFPLKMSIPGIGLEWVSYEGADSLTLEQGPGHIEETPLPGDVGRCTISGHRTTYGSPFERIDEIKEGDLIYLETFEGGLFIYAVTEQQIVLPKDVYVLEGSKKKELLLTTCHPKYSAAKRLIIIAELLNLYPLELDTAGGRK